MVVCLEITAGQYAIERLASVLNLQSVWVGPSILYGITSHACAPYFHHFQNGTEATIAL